MVIAVTGASGYLGTHMVLCLLDRGENVVGISPGTEVPMALKGKLPFHSIAAEDYRGLTEVFKTHGVRSVIHFAGGGSVPASLIDPYRQYAGTLVGTLTMLKAATRMGVEQIVFSSTAAVYGVPERMPIKEETPLHAISPFGAAMAMAERVISDVCRPAAISTVTLRYFNVAGADPNGRAGEDGPPRHLIKAAAQIAVGTLKRPLKIYGADYDTPDGTAIRDYLHVADMAEAHADALDYLVRGGASVVLNCGYGEGVSVREVIEAVERVTGQPLPTEQAPRRAGDPPLLIADNAAIRSTLGWTPRYADIDTVVRSAIGWEAQHPAAA